MYKTLEILEFCFKNSILLYYFPSYTSHKLQPYNITVFAPLKVAYRDQVERLEQGGIGIIGKQHFTYLYSPARERAFTKRNILTGWKASGLYPFNPDKILVDIPKPVSKRTAAEPTILTLRTYGINLYPQAKIV